MGARVGAEDPLASYAYRSAREDMRDDNLNQSKLLDLLFAYVESKMVFVEKTVILKKNVHA